MDDELIHLAGREQVAVVAGMTGLGTPLAASRRAGRAGRGTRGIAGRGAGGVARVALELAFEVREARLERLDLVEQGAHDGADGGGRGIPIRGRNAEGWRKLAHAGSMRPAVGVVKSFSSPHCQVYRRPERILIVVLTFANR